jgi:hypothetical protein
MLNEKWCISRKAAAQKALPRMRAEFGIGGEEKRRSELAVQGEALAHIQEGCFTEVPPTPKPCLAPAV